MSYNQRKRNDRSESYGIFDETGIKQKLSIPGFERTEEEFAKQKQNRSFERPNEKPYFENNRNTERPNMRDHKKPQMQNIPVQAKTPMQPNTPKNFFVFDIETVPCIETARIFLNLGSEVSDDEVVTKLTAYHSEITNGQNEFFRQLFHKVVCVSFIAGTIQPLKGGREKYIIKSIKTGGRNGESEEEILRPIFAYLQKHPSRLISFNGRGFDLPVMQYRAMKYGIDAKWIYNDGYYNYNHRYSIEKHCDLLDMFSNFGASARVKMSEVAALFKVPCKFNGINGSNVYELFKSGKVEEICNYCEDDVIATYILYLRFMEHSGKLSAEGYNIVIDNLIAMLKADTAPAHQTLFAEKFLALNLGNVSIKIPSEANMEKAEEQNLEQDLQEQEVESSLVSEEVSIEENSENNFETLKESSESEINLSEEENSESSSEEQK